MKYFVKVVVIKNEKECSTYYFIPELIPTAEEIDEYLFFARLDDDKYSIEVNFDRKCEFKEELKPKEKIVFKHNKYEFKLSLLSTFMGKGIVKSYLIKQRASVKKMEEFYYFIGKKMPKKPRRSTGPWNPYSGMDPDVKADYERGENIEKK